MITFIVRIDIEPMSMNTEQMEEIVERAVKGHICHYHREDDTDFLRVDDYQVKVLRIQ